MPFQSRRRSSIGLLSAALAGALATSCASAPPQPPQKRQLTAALSPPDRDEPPQQLSPAARDLLRSRMALHAADMSNLVSAIMILEYRPIAERAASIASDANLARPLSDDATDLASAIPESFFMYQDQLRLQARALSQAAEVQSAVRVADAYGRLSETCVRCHAVYRAAH